MDEPSGADVADVTGASPGLSVDGVAAAEGLVGGARRFDGTSGYVGAPDGDRWAFGTRDFTVELWANWDQVQQGSVQHPGTIFVGNDEGPNNVNKWFFALGGGFLNVALNSPTLGPQFFPLVPFSPDAGRWYHLAVTRQKSLYVVYVDGEPLGSAMNEAVIPDADAPLTIGQAEGLGFMRGRLDEVTIYDRALEAAEVRSIFQAGAGGKCKAPSEPPPAPESPPEPPPDAAPSPSPAPAPSPPPAAPDLVGQPTSNLRIHKTATVAVPGRVIDNFVVVENVGPTASDEAQVFQALDPGMLTLVSTSPAAAPDAPMGLLAWDVPPLAPGESKTLLYQARLDPKTPPGGLLPPSVACVVDDLAALAGCLLNFADACAACAPVCVGAVAKCKSKMASKACIGLGTSCLGCFPGCGQGSVALTQCLKNRNACADHPQPVRAALDPNEKLVVAERFVRSDQRLVYPIHFENIGDAEARDVFVTDVISSALDLSTAELLTPAGGAIDGPSRTIRWNLLDRNLEPAETGNVLLAIRPARGLPSGTEIRNKAVIQFEVFTPMETDEVVSVIDDVAPACAVAALPASTPTADFVVSWKARDPIGAVASSSVWVSTNDGPFAPLLEKTTATSTTFHGADGTQYAFLCVATDTAGNVEAQPPVAEAETRVTFVRSACGP
jgi:uncharacterized repeat protein (TIGR01451 family)